MLGTVGREFSKDAVNLRPLLGGKFSELIIGLNRRHGLDEDGRPGGGDIMHQTVDGALVLSLHWHHIAVGTLGDNGLLQNLGITRRGDDLLQGIPGTGSRGPHLAADIGKVGGCSIRDLIFAGDGACDLFLKKTVGVQGVEQVVDGRLADGVIREVTTHEACALEDVGDLQQLPRVEAAAEIGAGKGRTHVLHAVKRRAAAHHHHGFGGCSLAQAVAHFALFDRGRQLQSKFFGRLAYSLRSQHGQYCRQFQGVEGFFKKTHSLFPICV